MSKDACTNFLPIDIDSWERKEYFLHFYNNVRCSYSVTANIDITEIYVQAKAHGLRLYPALIWWVANAVNHFEFLRFNHDENGIVGRYSIVHPSFTYMPPQSDRFHVLWTKYDPDFQKFYPDCVQTMDSCDTSRMFPMDDMPKNCFDLSSVPWIEFTAFNLNTFSADTHLAPIFTTGKLIRENQRVKLPFCLQIHHSVCDGYHADQLFSYLQDLADKPDSWMH